MIAFNASLTLQLPPVIKNRIIFCVDNLIITKKHIKKAESLYGVYAPMDKSNNYSAILSFVGFSLILHSKIKTTK